MLADSDKKSNEIYDACLNAGINDGTIQLVKRKLRIKSLRKIDDWYWTLDRKEEDTKEAEILETEPIDEADETPVRFLDDINNQISIDPEPETEPKLEPTAFKPGTVTMQSPFGELTLIDWRACGRA